MIRDSVDCDSSKNIEDTALKVEHKKVSVRPPKLTNVYVRGLALGTVSNNKSSLNLGQV